MNGFERRRQLKRESIKLAAARLFQHNTVEKVTVQEIAAVANVSYAVVFKYFGSKQDLVLEVMKWLYAQAYDELEEILHSDKPYLERMQAMMLHKGKLFENANIDLFRHASSYNPEEIAQIAAFYEEKKQKLYHEFFQEGKKQGFIHPDIPIDSIIIHRDALRALIQANPEILTEFKHNADLLKGFMRILLFGIMGKEKLPNINISL
jgi:AcrR family transcriptional regulator